MMDDDAYGTLALAVILVAMYDMKRRRPCSLLHPLCNSGDGYRTCCATAHVCAADAGTFLLSDTCRNWLAALRMSPARLAALAVECGPSYVPFVRPDMRSRMP